MRTIIRHRDRKEWRTDNGDTWGAYIMCEDGWWRLNSELYKEVSTREGTRTVPINFG